MKNGEGSHDEDLEKVLERIDKAEEQLHRLDSVLRVAKWILGMCIAGVIGSVITIGMKIYSEGYDKGQLVDRVDQLEKKFEKHLSKGIVP